MKTINLEIALKWWSTLHNSQKAIINDEFDKGMRHYSELEDEDVLQLYKFQCEQAYMEDPKVESYFVRKYSNGVYSLTFCMNKRGVHYNMISDTTLVFGDEFTFFEIEPFLPTDIRFTRADQQCKDQISIYYIPLEDRGEIILDKKLN